MIRGALRRLRWLVLGVTNVVPTSWLEALLYHLAARRADHLDPDEALRFLFRLDNRLYGLHGGQAIEYDDGIHTKHRHIGYHDFFVERIGPGERVLDLGCGKGELTYAIADRSGAHVLGVDISQANIEIARKRFSHPQVIFTVGDVLEEIPDGSFDVVVLSNVLEHLPSRPELLRQVQESTGATRFLIRVPLFERHWSVPLKRELGVDWRLDETHETEYTHTSFEQEMDDAELQIEEMQIRWGEIWAEAHGDDKG